jgi:hypothetical protein
MAMTDAQRGYRPVYTHSWLPRPWLDYQLLARQVTQTVLVQTTRGATHAYPGDYIVTLGGRTIGVFAAADFETFLTLGD